MSLAAGTSTLQRCAAIFEHRASPSNGPLSYRTLAIFVRALRASLFMCAPVRCIPKMASRQGFAGRRTGSPKAINYSVRWPAPPFSALPLR
jgi:hypothetical protein